MGSVIRMDSMSSSDARAARINPEETGFEKACKALDALFECTAEEKRVAIQNWHASGLLTNRERNALYGLFQWEVPG